jgi:hypothetical protein
MTARFLRWFLLLPLVALLCGQPGVAPAQDDPKEIARRLEVLRQQIDGLRQQEQALLKLQEEQRKAAEEKKSQYVKVEIRGRLLKENRGGGPGSALSALWVWDVKSGELTWPLDLGEKKELLAAAEPLAGKAVVITGKVEGRNDGRSFGPVPVVIVESLKPAEK